MFIFSECLVCLHLAKYFMFTNFFARSVIVNLRYIHALFSRAAKLIHYLFKCKISVVFLTGQVRAAEIP